MQKYELGKVPRRRPTDSIKVDKILEDGWQIAAVTDHGVYFQRPIQHVQKWEYLLERFAGGRLDYLGEQGWELVQVLDADWIFKRPVVETVTSSTLKEAQMSDQSPNIAD